MTATRPAPDGRAVPSRTPGTLRSLRVALVVGCAMACSLSVLVFAFSHRTVDQALRRSGPAVIQVDAVYEALVEADRTAVADIRSGTARLGGAAGGYGNEIAAVHQGLELIAEHNAAGEEGSRELELISGLVVSYSAQIQQAYADAQQTDAGASQDRSSLSLAYLSYASYLLHQPGSGVLDHLEELRGLQQDALDRQRSSFWVGGYSGLLWLVPTAVTLVLVVITQVFISRRFRRLLSVWLLLAAVALAVMASITWRSETSQAKFTEAVDGSFAHVTDQREDQAASAASRGRKELTGLLSAACKRSCADEITGEGFLPFAMPAASGDSGRSGRRFCADDVQGDGLVCFRKDAEAADSGLGVPVALIALLGGGAAVLVAFGLRPRINEYRPGRSR